MEILRNDDDLVGVRIGHDRLPVDVIYVLSAADLLNVGESYDGGDSCIIIGSTQDYSGVGEQQECSSCQTQVCRFHKGFLPCCKFHGDDAAANGYDQQQSWKRDSHIPSSPVCGVPRYACELRHKQYAIRGTLYMWTKGNKLSRRSDIEGACWGRVPPPLDRQNSPWGTK